MYRLLLMMHLCFLFFKSENLKTYEGSWHLMHILAALQTVARSLIVIPMYLGQPVGKFELWLSYNMSVSPFLLRWLQTRHSSYLLGGLNIASEGVCTPFKPWDRFWPPLLPELEFVLIPAFRAPSMAQAHSWVTSLISATLFIID